MCSSEDVNVKLARGPAPVASEKMRTGTCSSDILESKKSPEDSVGSIDSDHLKLRSAP